MDQIEQKLWESYRESYKQNMGLYPEVDEYMDTFIRENDPEFVTQCQGLMYHLWSSMIDVCKNPENELYPKYGGRGLRIHPPWLEPTVGLIHFIYDVKFPEQITDSLVLIDEMDDFYPHNIKWVRNKIEINDDDDD